MNVHRVFLGFMAGPGLLGLVKQTWDFAQFAVAFWSGGGTDLPAYFNAWFYGLHVRSLFFSFDLDAAWPPLLLVLGCYVAWRVFKK